MDEELQTTRLLTRAADSAGDFAPVAVDDLTARRSPRTGVQPMLAVAASVVVVAGLAVGLSVVGSNGGNGNKQSMPAGSAAATVADLQHYRWRSLPPAPITTKHHQVTQWTGKVLLVVGDNGQSASYDPAKRQWRKLPAGAPVMGGNSVRDRYDQTVSAWYRNSLYLWNTKELTPFGSGARYDVATNSWHKVAALPHETSAIASLAVAGGHLFSFGVDNYQDDASAVNVGEYDPASDSWTARGTFGQSHNGDKIKQAKAVTAGSKAVVLVQMLHPDPKKANTFEYASPVVYSYSADNTADRLAKLKYGDNPEWIQAAGDNALLPNVVVGASSDIKLGATSDLLDPTGHITRTPSAIAATRTKTGGDVPDRIYLPGYVWTGRAFVALDGGFQAWQPGDTSWTPIAATKGNVNGDAVWANDRLVALCRGAVGCRGSEFAPR